MVNIDNNNDINGIRIINNINDYNHNVCLRLYDSGPDKPSFCGAQKLIVILWVIDYSRVASSHRCHCNLVATINVVSDKLFNSS